jgi:hypothetical protein
MKLQRSLFAVGVAGLVMAGCGTGPRAEPARVAGPPPISPSWMIKELNNRMTPRTWGTIPCTSWAVVDGSTTESAGREIGVVNPKTGEASIAYFRTCGSHIMHVYVPNKLSQDPCMQYATPNRTYPLLWASPVCA